LGGAKNMYVHGREDTDGRNGMAAFIGEVAVELSASDEGGYAAQASSVEAEDGVTPLPPTSLRSDTTMSLWPACCIIPIRIPPRRMPLPLRLC